MANNRRQNIQQIGGGLKPTPKDRRDFKLGQIIKWPKLEELPKSFELPALTIKNQKQTDKCTAYATCGMSELQEGVELNPDYVFAVSKEISGNPDDWGQDIRMAMKAHVKVGTIEQKDAIQLSEKESRYLANYPSELKEKAKKHIKESFFEVAGYPVGWIASDAIKAAIWTFRALKRAVGIGVIWSWPLSEQRIMTWNLQGTGHMIYIRGWRNDGFLLVQNSYGKEAGENGSHYFSPVVIDKAVAQYKAFMFVDIPPEEYKQNFWPWWIKIIEAFKNYIKELFN